MKIKFCSLNPTILKYRHKMNITYFPFLKPQNKSLYIKKYIEVEVHIFDLKVNKIISPHFYIIINTQIKTKKNLPKLSLDLDGKHESFSFSLQPNFFLLHFCFLIISTFSSLFFFFLWCFSSFSKTVYLCFMLRP